MSAPALLSLRRQLLLWLLLPQLVLWAGGGLLTYRIALSYAEKGIDQSLTQSVRALARQVKPVGSGLLIDFPRAAQDVLEQDPDDRISYMVSSPPGQFLLGNQRLRQALVAAITTLPEREQLIMSMYYEQDMNLKEIAAVLGVTESRICQLHSQSIARLRAKMRAH